MKWCINIPSPPHQKMTPQEVKDKLGKCGRLDELRARLLKVNQCSEKLRQFRVKTLSGSDTPKILSPRKVETGIPLEKFSTLEIELPARWEMCEIIAVHLDQLPRPRLHQQDINQRQH